MAKNKKRGNIADRLTQTKSATIKAKKKLNPFEVHVNKEKFSILGRQLKHDKGMPGVSRGKALKRRKETLGQEYMNKNKTNKFKDRRIGEVGMSKEEAANARFMAEQLNKFKKNSKQSRYNLSEDLVLTHKGQTMEQIEQFKDKVSDNDTDDDDELGKLDEKFTGTAHFGGGRDDGDGPHEATNKSRKDAIDDLIAEQKRRKIEILKDKEEVQEMTELLDANWRSIIPLMGKLNKTEEAKPKPDEYDRALREMIFEPRGAVSDKLKSEEEILKEEKAKLERLERERRERMEGNSQNTKNKHRSADDLDDGYFLQPVMHVNTDKINGQKKNEEEDEDEVLEEFDKMTAEQSNETHENATDATTESENDSDDDRDSLNDLKDTDSSDEDKASDKDVKQCHLTTPKICEEVPSTLPFTFDLPTSYSDLENLMENRNPIDQQIIIERMIKCNHPKLLPENKDKMIQLFTFTLQHLNDTFQDVTASSVHRAFDILHRLSPHLFDLLNINSVQMTKCFREVIIEKQAEFREHSKEFPELDTLVFLKLVPVFYSTSDFQHSIVTPCFVFISQLLTRCRICTRKDIASGLFLVAVVMEYTQLSRRFLPAAINFLVGVLFLAVRKRPIETYKLPFQVAAELNSLLVLNENHSKSDFSAGTYLNSCDLLVDKIDNDFKVRAINSTLRLTCDMLNLLSSNKSCQYLSMPVEQIVNKIDSELYPDFVAESSKQLNYILSKLKQKQFDFPDAPVKQPKTLRMLEPRFDKVYDDKRTRKPEAIPKAIRQGLVRKIKSETRGAIREIRRDNAFLANVELKKQLQSDKERKEKVRRIFSEASIQQGELNALDRKKKHR